LDQKAKDKDLFADFPNIDPTLKDLISNMLVIDEEKRLSWWIFLKENKSLFFDLFLIFFFFLNRKDVNFKNYKNDFI